MRASSAVRPPLRRSGRPLPRILARLSLLAAALLLPALTACDADPLGAEPAGEIRVATLQASYGQSASGTVVTPSAASVTVGGSVQLVALDASGNPVSVRWSSGNEAVAKVSAGGLVTGVAPGTASITARAKNQSAQAAVTVTGQAQQPQQPATDFGAVVRGVRPRGFGQGTYTPAAPASGGIAYYVDPAGNDAAPGTASQPFRTINRAAQAAVAGDVVTIRAGTYRESVSVKNAGTVDRPIVFQAESRGAVVLTGGSYNFAPAGWSSGVMQSGPVHVTVRGLVFRDYAPQAVDTGHRVRAAVGAIRGWRIEDCLFERAGFNGVDVRGSDVVIERSTFQYTFTNAITAWSPRGSWLDGLRIVDVVLRANNTRTDVMAAQDAEAVAKLLNTRGALIDNMESYENRGSGFWLDTENVNYTIRNSYFHDNADKGLFLEINWASGLVENNVFLRNADAGVFIANSAGVSVVGNLFSQNAQCVALVNVDRGTDSSGNPVFPLKNVTVQRNQCRDWKTYSAVHALGGSFSTPSQMGIVADGNTYEPVTTAALAWWPNTGGFMTTIPTVQSKLGWETAGRIGAVPVP